MRVISSIVLVLFCLVSLPAQQEVWSNSIGQDRGTLDEQSSYTLLSNDEGVTLFHQGEPLWRRSKKNTSQGFELSTFTFADNTTHFKRYENSRLIAEGEGESRVYFYYDDRGLMIKSTTLLSGTLSEMELYSYDEGSKRLASILTITKEGSKISYYGESVKGKWFSYTEDDLFTKVTHLASNLQVQERWKGNNRLKGIEVELPQEGGIRLTSITKEGEVGELYDEAGLLVLRTTPTHTTQYLYTDERTLLTERETGIDGYERTVLYAGGRAVSETLSQDGVIEKETRYPQGSGKVETLFDEGVPYCDITYAIDGVRVLSIKYR